MKTLDFRSDRRGSIDLEPDMEVATSDLMLPLLINNFGIGFVPEARALPLLEKKKLVRIQIDCEIPGRSIQLAMDKGRGKRLAADGFRNYLNYVFRTRLYSNCKKLDIVVKSPHKVRKTYGSKLYDSGEIPESFMLEQGRGKRLAADGFRNYLKMKNATNLI